jgi:sugar phosphate isomerase/epimerase
VRFGIMSMQRQAMIPTDLSIQAALAHVAGFDHADLARRLHARGFNPIELGGDMPMLLPGTLDASTIERLGKLKEETGISYTVHLPLWSVEPSTPLAPVREGSVRAVVNVITATLPLAPEVYVLHATGALAAEFYRMSMPDLAREFLLRQFQANARDSIRALLSETGLPSRQLAIETVEFPLGLTLELADELDVSICLDTGHVLVGFAGPVALLDALEQCLLRLREIHLHDAPWQGPQQTIRYGQDHRPLGTGDLDVARFLGRLEEAGFQGPLIFELTVPEALQSLEAIRFLRTEPIKPSTAPGASL